MVFCSLFPTDADQYPDLREALDKLKLSMPPEYEPETSSAMGFGFRCGFWACCTWRSCRNGSARIRP